MAAIPTSNDYKAGNGSFEYLGTGEVSGSNPGKGKNFSMKIIINRK